MTTADLLGRLRQRIGNPNKVEVSDLALLDAVNAALVELVDELQFRVVTDTSSIALVAEQQDYGLPNDVLSILWVSHNDRRLEPLGLAERDRDLEEWRSLSSSTPTQFAVRGRRIYLLPAPSASDVEDDGYLTFSYVGAPEEMGAQGPVGLSDNDQWLLIWMAALDYCMVNPSEMNQVRIPGYQMRKQQMMERAKSRWVSQGATAAKHFVSGLKPFTGGRMGGAR